MLKLNTISSCVFISNVIVLLIRGFNRHAFLFSFLFFTSVIMHEVPSFQIHVLDQLAILLVALNGAWLVYKNFRVSPALFVAVSTFLGSFYLYEYGRITGGYCFDPQCWMEWHAFFHVVCSVGHHALAAL